MSAFAVGDRVRTCVENPGGHTRLPGYARGRVGTIEAVQPAFPRPDQAAAGAAVIERCPVYTVAFADDELWGNDAQCPGRVLLEVWEHQLQLLVRADRSMSDV
jgi:hypothetical protein